MNKWVGIGRLVRDPEVRYSQGGNGESMAIARYSLAVNRRYKRAGEPEADFVNCVCFGKSAEFVEKYFRKGTKVAVAGAIRTGNYTNKDGQKVYTTDVIIDEQEFAESKANGEKSEEKPSANDGFIPIPDGIEGDLPFH